MRVAEIERIRRFNRAVAEGIGALHNDYLGRGRPLGEARVLWEVGADGAEVRELRERLGFDSGYLSRLLRSLERQRLVRVRAAQSDRRLRRVELTTRGRRERQILDARSDAIAQRILEPLTSKQRAAFLSAASTIEQLLQPSMVQFTLERPSSADAQWCWKQYFAELNDRFEAGFDPARALPVDAREVTPPGGAIIIARLHGRPIGSGSIKTPPQAPAYIKRMWIAREARGLGVGRRLLAALEDHARSVGARVVQLETNRALQEAIALYRSAGFVEVPPFNAEPYAHHWFEKRLSRARAPVAGDS
jgi:DNA-binding MarR family transcriptional regulator/GNAT superfamily N-acetyltransferase